MDDDTWRDWLHEMGITNEELDDILKEQQDREDDNNVSPHAQYEEL